MKNFFISILIIVVHCCMTLNPAAAQQIEGLGARNLKVERNYIKDGNAEAYARGWSTYNELLTRSTSSSLTDEGGDLINAGANTSFREGQAVLYSATATPIGGLTSGNTYYIRNPGGVEGVAVNFQLSSSVGGALIDLTSDGSGDHFFRPVRAFDGTGGTSTLTAMQTTTTSPLEGKKSFLLTHPSSSALGQGWSFPFSIETKDKAKVLNIDIEYMIASGTFVPGTSSTDSDLVIGIYDVTNSTYIEPTSTKFLSNHTSLSSKLQATFQSSSSSTSYRLIVHNATANTSAFTMKLEFAVSPSRYVYGTPITDWTEYTPTFVGLGTVTNIKFWWRRVGDSIHIQGSATAGTTTAVSMTVTLPTGLTINFNKLNTNNNQIVGRLNRHASGNNNDYTALVTNGDNKLYFSVTDLNTVNPASASDGSVLIGTGALFTIYDVVLPINGWSSSVQMSDQVDTRVSTFRAYRGSNQTGINTNASAVKINMNTVTFDTHGGFDTSGFKYTVQVPGFYRCSAAVTLASTNVLANLYQVMIYKNGSGFTAGQTFYPPSAVSFRATVTDTVQLNAGDYLEVYLYGSGNNSASTLTVSGATDATFLSCERVSGPSTIAANETVAVSLSGSATSITSSLTDIVATSELVDTHGAFSSATFTVPVAGIYEACAFLRGSSVSYTNGHAFSVYLRHNAVDYEMGYTRIQATQATVSAASGCAMVRAIAGDTLKFGGFSSVTTTAAQFTASIKRVGM